MAVIGLKIIKYSKEKLEKFRLKHRVALLNKNEYKVRYFLCFEIDEYPKKCGNTCIKIYCISET